MDKIYLPKFSNIITKERYFLIIDNKDNRRFCNTNMNKIKLGKKDINLQFFENKNLNTFWTVDKNIYEQITHKEFFNENLCKNNHLY